MTDPLSNSVLAWLLTYAVHSAILLSLAWLVSRRAVPSPAVRDFIWKVALVGGVVTATAQLALGVRPNGSLALHDRSAASAPVPAVSASVRNDAADRTPALSNAPPGETSAQYAVTRTGDTRATEAGTFSWPRTELLLVLGWAVIALVLAAAYAARRLILVGRLIDRQLVTDGPVPAMLEEMRRSGGYRGRIRLTTASTISSPVALGLGEICVPPAALTELDGEQQRGLLAHEVAHLTRRDPLWLDAASMIERIFFFQPLNRVARREMQHAAEYLCDDWAAARVGSGLPLAKCLARVAEWIQLSPLGVPMAGMAEQRSLLVSRIARLVEGRARGSSTPRFALAGSAVLLLAATVAAAPGVQQSAPLMVPAAHESARPHAEGPGRVGVSNAPRIAGVGITASNDAPEDTAVVNALIERLKDTDAGVRKAAAEALGNISSRRAVAALIAVLGDKSHEVRAAAAGALGNIQDPSSSHALAQLLTDTSADVREHALDALSNFAHDVPLAPVIAALSDSRPDIRARATHLLGEIDDITAVGPLTRALKDPSANVREEATHALEQLKDPSSAPALLGALHDEHADVRAGALNALREIGAPIAESVVLAALADDAADVRAQAAMIAGDHQVVNAVPVLRHLIDDPSSDVREQAIEALSNIRTQAARDALKSALKSSDAKVREWATEALGSRP